MSEIDDKSLQEPSTSKMTEIDDRSLREPSTSKMAIFIHSLSEKYRAFQMDNRSDESRPLFGGEFTDRPLFGDSNRKDRAINLLIGCISGVIFTVTLLSAFLAKTPIRGLNIYFVFCIFLICLSHILLIYWYRQGDLDPKFRLLIYYNSFTMVLLCTCALSFFFTE